MHYFPRRVLAETFAPEEALVLALTFALTFVLALAFFLALALDLAVGGVCPAPAS